MNGWRGGPDAPSPAARRAHRTAALAALLAILLTAACQPAAPPAPATTFDWDGAARLPRPFPWRLESGAWDACTVVARTARPLTDDDADELEAVLTDWYNLGRLGAFKDDARPADAAAAEAMADPWQPAPDTLAATFHLGTMPRLGLAVLLNALEGYHAQQAPLAEVVLCAEPPPAAPPRQSAT
ncbi:MAG TPA: hypothetical protein VFE37_11090 [Chloroflexota bacterium]|nr:hypothetical protein [Chloroflexota bacterium]